MRLILEVWRYLYGVAFCQHHFRQWHDTKAATSLSEPKLTYCHLDSKWILSKTLSFDNIHFHTSSISICHSTGATTLLTWLIGYYIYHCILQLTEKKYITSNHIYSHIQEHFHDNNKQGKCIIEFHWKITKFESKWNSKHTYQKHGNFRLCVLVRPQVWNEHRLTQIGRKTLTGTTLANNTTLYTRKTLAHILQVYRANPTDISTLLVLNTPQQT